VGAGAGGAWQTVQPLQWSEKSQVCLLHHLEQRWSAVNSAHTSQSLQAALLQVKALHQLAQVGAAQPAVHDTGQFVLILSMYSLV
jgi:hypothetical protein